VFLSINAYPATYYVQASEGSDSNSGTLETPFKTIGKAISTAVSGDIVMVRSGIYNEAVTISKSNITLCNYPDESPVIDGTGRVSGYIILVKVSGSYCVVRGFEIRNSNMGGTIGSYAGGGVGISLDGHHNTASRCKVHHTWIQAIRAAGDYSIVEDCEIYQCSQINYTTNSISVFGKGGWSCNLQVARDPVNGITEHAIIRRNVVYNNYGEGIDTYEAGYCTVEDNISYDNWTINFYIADCHHCLFQRNIVYRSPNTTFPLRAAGSGINYFDEQANGTTIPYSTDNILINNLTYNCGIGCYTWTNVYNSGLKNVLIANNTLVNGKLNIGFGGTKNVTHENTRIFNNIIMSSGSSIPSNAGITFSNNCWSGTPPTAAQSPGDIIGDVVGDIKVSKAGGTDSGQLTADFFKLLKGSPAIGKGLSLDEVQEDFFKESRDVSPDLGAIEFKEISSIDVTTQKSSGLTFAPNPANGITKLFFQMSIPKDVTVSVCNLSGKEIYRKTQYLNPGLNEWKLVMGNEFKAGMYMVFIDKDSEIMAEKLVVL